MKFVIAILVLVSVCFAATPCSKSPTSRLCTAIGNADKFLQAQAQKPADDLAPYTVAVVDPATDKVVKETKGTEVVKTPGTATASLTPKEEGVIPPIPALFY